MVFIEWKCNATLVAKNKTWLECIFTRRYCAHRCLLYYFIAWRNIFEMQFRINSKLQATISVISTFVFIALGSTYIPTSFIYQLFDFKKCVFQNKVYYLYLFQGSSKRFQFLPSCKPKPFSKHGSLHFKKKI